MSTATWIIIGVVFVVGVLLLGISSAMLRSVSAEPRAQSLTWLRLVDESLGNADVQLRLDMIERLAIVNSAWSRDVLQRAQDEETNASVRSAIDLALQR